MSTHLPKPVSQDTFRTFMQKCGTLLICVCFAKTVKVQFAWQTDICTYSVICTNKTVFFQTFKLWFLILLFDGASGENAFFSAVYL